jgi:hypothetical protein
MAIPASFILIMILFDEAFKNFEVMSVHTLNHYMNNSVIMCNVISL